MHLYKCFSTPLACLNVPLLMLIRATSVSLGQKFQSEAFIKIE